MPPAAPVPPIAAVTEAAGGHPIYVSQPRATAELIKQAARQALAEAPQTV